MQFKHLWFALIALATALSAWLSFVWSTPSPASAAALQQMTVLAALVGLMVFLIISGIAAGISALRHRRARA